jgi:hypothetical protein
MTTKKKKAAKKKTVRKLPVPDPVRVEARRRKLLMAQPPGVKGTDAAAGKDQNRDVAELYAVMAADLRDWQAGVYSHRHPLVAELHQQIMLPWKPDIEVGLTDADKIQMALEVNDYLDKRKTIIRQVQKKHGWPEEDYAVTALWAGQMAKLMVLTENKPLAPYVVPVQLW